MPSRLAVLLFTTTRTWKQPRCPSADEWIRKLWYIYTMEYRAGCLLEGPLFSEMLLLVPNPANMSQAW